MMLYNTAVFLLLAISVSGKEFFKQNHITESMQQDSGQPDGDGGDGDGDGDGGHNNGGNFDVPRDGNGHGGDLSNFGGFDAAGTGGGNNDGFYDGDDDDDGDDEYSGDDYVSGDGDGGDLSNFGGFDADGTGGGNNDGFYDFGAPSSGGNPFGGMDQTDDVLSAMGGFGTSMITMMFGQCLKNIDLDRLLEDPFADVDVGCNTQQAATFNNALNSFETCAGFDLKALIEKFASIYVGLLMNCGSYALTVSNELDGIGMGTEDMDTLKAKESPLPRVPKGCVEALVGNNPFGQAVMYVNEFPERELKCFSELAGKLPMCTLNEWPIPIVGSWLSSFSCIYGSLQDVITPMMQDSISSQFEVLSLCIPAEVTAANCKEIRNRCIFDYDDPSLIMAIPPPFWNPPMTQTCKDTTADSGMADLVDRYEAFRQTCTPPADLAIWDIAASHQEKHNGTEGGGASFMETAAATPPASSGVSPNSSEPTSGVFAKGLFAGMIVAVVGMFGFSKVRSRGSQRPMGDDFDSLELAETPAFT